MRLCVPFAPSPAPLAVAIARRAFPRRSRENPPSPRGAPSSSRFVRIWDASLTPSPPLAFPPLSSQDWNVAKVREERREEAEEMFRLWKQDPDQWLIRSKIAWSRRHESKRASSQRAREVPSLAAPASRAAGGRAPAAAAAPPTARARGQAPRQRAQRPRPLDGVAQDVGRRRRHDARPRRGVDLVPAPDVERRVDEPGGHLVSRGDVPEPVRVGHLLQAHREPEQEGGRRVEERAVRRRGGADAGRAQARVPRRSPRARAQRQAPAAEREAEARERREEGGERGRGRG